MMEMVRQEGFFEAKDGLRIHYEMYLHPDSIASVVIAHGFTESADKFREMARRCYARGYSVFALDHRGHGKSDRLVRSALLVHVDNFVDYVEDFERFVDLVVVPNSSGGRLLPFGFSMGGAIVALALLRRPQAYARAVLASPMIQAKSKGVPLKLAQLMTRALCAMGMSRRRMMTFPKNSAAPTVGWVRNAMDVPDVLTDTANAGVITCPVLLFQAENDASVENQAQQRFITLVPQGRLVQIAGSPHELTANPAEVVESYYNRMLAFFDGKE